MVGFDHQFGHDIVRTRGSVFIGDYLWIIPDINFAYFDFDLCERDRYDHRIQMIALE